MSKESIEWRNRNTLIGFTEQRGNAWHLDENLQDDLGLENNHYPGAIPVDDVLRRLLHWQAVSGTVETTFYDEAKDEERTIIDPTRQSIIRPDINTIFGVFKDGYQIHQHDEWLLEGAASIMDQSVSDVGIANAVLLKGGAVAAIQYELPETIKIVTDIAIRPSLLACGSMDGSLRTGFRSVVNNVVCDNTMTAAIMAAMAVILFKHSKYSPLKITDAQEALHMLFDIGRIHKEEVTKLLSVKVTGKDFTNFLHHEAPIVPNDDGNHPLTLKPWTRKAEQMGEAKQAALLNLWLNDERVSPWMGNAYGIWQMNNTYNHHFVATNQGTVRAERNMLNAASGEFGKDDRRALDVLFDKVLKVKMPV